MSVFHSKATRNSTKLDETQTLIQMPCVNVTFNNSIELQHFKTKLLCLIQAVYNKFFTDMLPPDGRGNRITCITDMSLSSNFLIVIIVLSSFCYFSFYIGKLNIVAENFGHLPPGAAMIYQSHSILLTSIHAYRSADKLLLSQSQYLY